MYLMSYQKNASVEMEKTELHLFSLTYYFLKPGDTFYPKDENGKWIYHETDLCATWEVRLQSTVHSKIEHFVYLVTHFFTTLTK